MTHDEQIAELREWLSDRGAIHELAIMWPPGSVVSSRLEQPLLVPWPGVEGEVSSYFENGRVGVTAPVTVPHPVHGWGSAGPGMLVSAECDPDALVLIRYGVFTSQDVREAIG